MDINLRCVNPGDLDAILEINRESIPGVAELNEGYFIHMLSESSYFRAVEVQDVLVGYICAFASDDNYDASEFRWFRRHLESDFLYIDQVAIAPSHRRAGIGKFIYQNIEKFASDNKFKNLVCEVNIEPLNVASWAFHRQSGFVEVGVMNTRGVVVSLLNKVI